MRHRIGIIGGGNMGSAIVRGCLRAGLFTPAEMIIAEIDPQRREQLRSLGCAVAERALDALDAEQLMLAVKPQAFSDVAQEIAPAVDQPRVVISIMAGVQSASIRQSLQGKARVVRAMPNLPCQIGEGMTAIALGEGAQAGDEERAKAIFSSIGRIAMVDESHMYAVTAVSGSGPAYVFLLAEAMERAAVSLGLPADAARLLVSQTIRGAGHLLTDSNASAAMLRQSVTSPGGTTAAALQVFNNRDFVAIVDDALHAADQRGRELGGDSQAVSRA